MGASASLRHRARPGSRDRTARPNPANVWHSRELHVGGGGSEATSDRTDTAPSSVPSSGRGSSRVDPGFCGQFPSRPGARHPDPNQLSGLRPNSPPPRPHRQCPRVRFECQIKIARGAETRARWEL